jgi:hypothetical protein
VCSAADCSNTKILKVLTTAQYKGTRITELAANTTNYLRNREDLVRKCQHMTDSIKSSYNVLPETELENAKKLVADLRTSARKLEPVIKRIKNSTGL